MATYRYEYTDTRDGGRIHRTWTIAGEVEACSMLAAIRKAKKAVRITGNRCDRSDYRHCIALRHGKYMHGMVLIVYPEFTPATR